MYVYWCLWFFTDPARLVHRYNITFIDNTNKNVRLGSIIALVQKRKGGNGYCPKVRFHMAVLYIYIHTILYWSIEVIPLVVSFILRKTNKKESERERGRVKRCVFSILT